jgi:hypothetical protein
VKFLSIDKCRAASGDRGWQLAADLQPIKAKG